MNEAQTALRLSPRDLGDPPHRRHDLRADAQVRGGRRPPTRNYVNLLPNKDHSEKADWSRAEIRFLRSFGQRVPFETEPGTDDRLYTVDFRLVNEKVVVRAKVNDASAQDFVVDTGSENTVITRRPRSVSASRRSPTRSAPASADVGLRGLQLARIDSLELGSLKLRNVPCLIKNPPLRDIPVEGNRRPVAAGARLLDGHRLQDAQADVRQAPARGAEGLRAAAAPAPARDGARHGRRRRTRRTSSSTPAAK